MKAALVTRSICLLVVVNLAAVFVLPHIFLPHENIFGAIMAALTIIVVFVSTLNYVAGVVRLAVISEKKRRKK